MRNKNVIITLLVVFAIICTYNLVQTYRAFSIDSFMKNASQEEVDEKKKDPDYMKSYKNAQENAFALGLDLQGGMFVTLEIGVEDIIVELAGDKQNIDDQFNTALEKARIKKQENSQDNMVDLFYESFQEINPNVKLSAYFANPDNNISFGTTNDEVIEFLKRRSEESIENTFSILRTRIDQFGVASPNLQLQAGTGRILVELPGVREPERVRKLLRNTAKLEFWETWPYNKGFKELENINQIVKRIRRLEAIENGDSSAISATQDSAAASPDVKAASPVNLETDASLAALTGNEADTTKPDTTGALEDDSLAYLKDSTLSDDERRKRYVEDFPLFENFAFIQNEEYSSYPNTPIMGYVRTQDTASFNKWLRHPEVLAVMPSEYKYVWGAKPIKDSDFLPLIAVKSNAEGIAPLEGDVVEDAKQDFNTEGRNDPIVSLSMNVDGSKKWSEITTRNVGSSVVILMDNLAYSWPRVEGPISGGRTQISGSFTLEEAKDLATLLSSGKLPVQARIEGEEIVGPTLGEDNITAGLWSFFVAFLCVIGFMWFYYAGAGLVSNIALVLNLFFILGISAALTVVFTLPGIAAIVLTMGMAVDANVIIYERIREERKHGKTFKSSVSSGFSNAFSAIIDGNITTFLTGVILFAFGVGPIKGFAVSLMIGIVTTLICGLLVSRLIIEYLAEKGGEPIKFGNKWTEDAFNNVKIKMSGRKKYFYGFSVVLTVLCLASILSFGFKTGVDFDGGRLYNVQYEGEVDVNALRSKLTAVFGNSAPVIKTVGTGNEILVTTSFKVTEQDASEEVKNLMVAGFTEIAPNSNPQVVGERVVGPTVANDIKRAAVMSVFFSLIVIFLYILVRFRKWQYSLGAISCLVHDTLVTMGIFSLLGALDIMPFSMEIDQAFIAAVLTIIGYSINDTVIVFDRIRENFGEMKTSSISSVFDVSIDQTFSRTIITSCTTLLTILVLFLAGGETIRGFMFALLIGIAVGTYSSIFIASPIAHDLLVAESKKSKDDHKK